jgi:hypothetical protein
MEAPIVLWALDDFAFHEAVSEVRVAVSANAVGGVKISVLIAIKSVGFAIVVEADDISTPQVGCGADLDPAIGVGAHGGTARGIVHAIYFWRQRTFYVVGGIFHLAENGGNDLPVCGEQSWIRRRAIVLHRGVKTRERVIGNQREHVMLHVVVHIPIQVSMDHVHVNGPAIQAVIQDVFGETRVLGEAVYEHHP